MKNKISAEETTAAKQKKRTEKKKQPIATAVISVDWHEAGEWCKSKIRMYEFYTPTPTYRYVVAGSSTYCYNFLAVYHSEEQEQRKRETFVKII